MIRTLSLAASVLAVLTGCGPKLISKIPAGQPLPLTIAVLPAEYANDIPREKVDLVRSSVIQALRNQNFLVVDDAVVQTLCSSSKCPERDTISKKYLVDGFATLTLSSFSKNNFIAGYYNQLSGELTITDRADTELVRVEHNENERGGVLLQSGQVLQGIIAQTKQSDESVFGNLAEKFAQTVVESLPAHSAPQQRERQEGVEVSLAAPKVANSTPSFYQVCARGTPDSFAFLRIGATSTSLREVTPGEYCGAFSTLTAPPANSEPFVELRSAFGNSVRRAVMLPAIAPCSLENRLTFTPAPNNGSISVSCTQVANDRSLSKVGCTDVVTPCVAEKLLVFKPTAPSGAFTRVTEIRSAAAKIPNPGNAELTLVAVQPGGVYSQPALIKGQ